MNRLAKLREWLTPAEAARQLTVSLATPCTAADVLQLGLDEQLVLSVRFLSPVPLLHSSSASIPGKPKKGTERHTLAGERRTSTPTEIWDLPLVGSERASVEARRQLLTGHRQFNVLPPLPVYVKGRDGDLWELPSRGLPPGCDIVVRSEALAHLEASKGAAPKGDERALRTRERRTLLTVIAAVCSIAKIDVAERGAGKRIVDAADLLGIKISPATISRILKEVREAVEDRKS
jgi:hypothetical protein